MNAIYLHGDASNTSSSAAAGVIDLLGGWRVLNVMAMTMTSAAVPAAFDGDLVLRLAASAYLGRFTGTSRTHTESDLPLFFTWCADQRLRRLEVQRAQVERYVRWMQGVRRFKPSTVSRRMAVVAGFYRTCVGLVVVGGFGSCGHREERGGQHREGGVPVPGVVEADLVIEPGLVLLIPAAAR